jgi:hypothetical protein
MVPGHTGGITPTLAAVLCDPLVSSGTLFGAGSYPLGNGPAHTSCVAEGVDALGLNED